MDIFTLLSRQYIDFEVDVLSQILRGKSILVTGAAGAIGSKLVKTLLQNPIQKLILVDQSESAMYALMQDISVDNALEIHWIIANITDKDGMERLFAIHKPQIVYHLAAYKNIPMLEKNPMAAIHNNVIGTQILADIAFKYKVEIFVLSSTDKSQIPTSYMGLTKRIGEIYLESLNQYCLKQQIPSRFLVAKFRNILDTPSSVFALFQQKIAQKQTIRLTHPGAFRYFMSCQEAAEFMLSLSRMDTEGGTFAIKIPNPTYILTLAKNMILSANLTLDKDISIEITGLRPGENPYETDIEEWGKLEKTQHPLIFRWKYEVLDYELLKKQIGHIEGKELTEIEAILRGLV